MLEETNGYKFYFTPVSVGNKSHAQENQTLGKLLIKGILVSQHCCSKYTGFSVIFFLQ